MASQVIIWGVGAEQVFVGAQEGGPIREAIVPDEDDPSPRTQDTRELPASRWGVEPVKRLSSGDEIDARIRHRDSFRPSVKTGEIWEAGQSALGGQSHGFVGLDSVDVQSCLQK